MHAAHFGSGSGQASRLVAGLTFRTGIFQKQRPSVPLQPPAGTPDDRVDLRHAALERPLGGPWLDCGKTFPSNSFLACVVRPGKSPRYASTVDTEIRQRMWANAYLPWTRPQSPGLVS
jgi:hypothetical protein